ncbi:Integrator complex subunit 9 [Coemansia erecta]|nr:Integrator complex subunit 9 [Coemansia sp. RSA 2618]KAJ2827587.1 Integrator complex subunit 9 [Coemansia erecta]
MPSICVIPFSPFERHHLLLCELEDTMFVVDCGWPTELSSDKQPSPSNKTHTAKSTFANPRDALSSINWSRVDFILVSNYEQMTLLPYITEYTEFAGPVYATEPTKAYGRCVLEEGLWTADADPQLPSTHSGSSSIASGSAQTAGRQNDEGRHRRLMPYTRQDVVAAMEKVQDVRLNEIIAPVPFVEVYARSSGYCIGGANWTVAYKGHRTAFISTSAFATCLHPQEWDASVISEAQALVFCDAVDPADSEDSDINTVPQNVQVSQRISQLCSTAISTLKQRSRVLLVGEPYGVTQDILQVVAENAISMNLPLPQFIFVSPVAEHTLQYGNIMGEWLCAAKQAMLYLPEYPFVDKDLRQKGHLHFVRSVSELATRNIPQGTWFVIVSPRDTHAISHFIRQWQLDAKQCGGADMASGTGAAKFSVLIHEDDVSRAQSIVNRISASSQVTYVPVSLRLTHHAIEQCLTSASCAQHVLVPSHVYSRLPPSISNSLDFKLLEYSYLQATVIDLDTDRHLPLNIQREMTLQLKRTGKRHAVISGQLLLAAGEIRLEHIDDSDGQRGDANEEGKHGARSADTARQPPTRMAANLGNYNLSAWSPERLANELGDIGLNATVVNQAADSSSDQQRLVRITVPGGTATIRMHGSWSVDCTSVNTQWVVLDSLRQVLKTA